MLVHHVIGDLLASDGAAALPGLGLAPLPHANAEEEEEGLVMEEGHESEDGDDDDDDDEQEELEEQDDGGGDEDEEDEEGGALERRRRGRLHEVVGRYLLAFFSLGFDFSPRSRKQAREASRPWGTSDSQAHEVVHLSGPKVYSCSNCRTHLSTDDDVISRAFQGRGGRAFLFEQVVNVVCGASEDRILMTGLHKVADIYCRHCRENLGWKYEEAFEESQKYKEGRFILEKVRITREAW